MFYEQYRILNNYAQRENLFCHLARFCNLVVEFNGLVSKRGQQQCWPFYMPASIAFQRFFVFLFLIFSTQKTLFYEHNITAFFTCIFFHEKNSSNQHYLYQMSKIKTAFFCSNCGYESAKWIGKCPPVRNGILSQKKY